MLLITAPAPSLGAASSVWHRKSVRTGIEHRCPKTGVTVPSFVQPLTATPAFFARLALPSLTVKAIFSKDFARRRRGRVAEGGGLLNRYTGYTVSGVRIPASPPERRIEAVQRSAWASIGECSGASPKAGCRRRGAESQEAESQESAAARAAAGAANARCRTRLGQDRHFRRSACRNSGQTTWRRCSAQTDEQSMR